MSEFRQNSEISIFEGVGKFFKLIGLFGIFVSIILLIYQYINPPIGQFRVELFWEFVGGGGLLVSVYLLMMGYTFYLDVIVKPLAIMKIIFTMNAIVSFFSFLFSYL